MINEYWPCVGAFDGATLADAVVVIVWAGAVETVVIANVIADWFALLFDVLTVGKCTNDSNCPKSSASLSIPPTKSVRPKRAYQRIFRWENGTKEETDKETQTTSINQIYRYKLRFRNSYIGSKSKNKKNDFAIFPPIQP